MFFCSSVFLFLRFLSFIMIQSFRQIKNRISAVQNTRKVTSAMEMISVAKLSRTNAALLTLRPYFQRMEKLFGDLVSSTPGVSNPFFEQRPAAGRISLCLLTSDGGLCGTYNNHIIAAAEEFMLQQGRERIDLHCVGRKGFNYFKKRDVRISRTYIGLNGRYSDKVAEEVTAALTRAFLVQETDAVYFVYAPSALTFMHKPLIEKFLNIETHFSATNETKYILEPDMQGILEELLPRYLAMKAKMIMLTAFASEHSARAMAMKMATDNAKELLENLIVLRNKVRQATITQDIMEIIASAEALKG